MRQAPGLMREKHREPPVRPDMIEGFNPGVMVLGPPAPCSGAAPSVPAMYIHHFPTLLVVMCTLKSITKSTTSLTREDR